MTHPSLEAYREPQVKGGKITMVDSDGNRMFIDENGIITYDSEQGISQAPTFLHNSDPNPPTCRVGGDSLPQESSKLSKGTAPSDKSEGNMPAVGKESTKATGDRPSKVSQVSGKPLQGPKSARSKAADSTPLEVLSEGAQAPPEPKRKIC